MKTNLYLFFILLPFLCIGCSKDEPRIEPDPVNPDTPTENTLTYIPIDWDKTTLNKLDTATGKVTMSFKDKVPEFKEGCSLIVIETDTFACIRRILETHVDGKTANLQTVEADMTELFTDMELTLSLEPSSERISTKSGIASISTNGTLHPVRIVEINEDHSYQTVYDIRKNVSLTRAQDSTELTLSFPEVDKSGKIIAASEDGNLSLYWETYKQNFSLNATVHFKFGKAIKEKKINENLKIKVSELEEFRFALDAHAQWDMIIGASMKGEFNYMDREVLIAPGLFKPRIFTFYTPTGIPIIITLGGDLLGDFSANGDAQMEVTGGVNLKGSLTTGIEYQERKWQPIGKSKFEYNLHPLEFTAFANFNLKASAYPKINIKMYNFLGPAFSPKPFVKDSVKMGIFNEIGSISKDYYGWTEKAYAGIDLQTSIMLNFIGVKKELFLPAISFEERFYNAPDEIKLKSPENGTQVQLNTPIEVIFNVTRSLLGTNLPLPAVVVKFESPNGKVNQNFVLTDLLGNAKVQWTPATLNDSLIAKIYNANGKVLSQANFKPKFPKEEFSIVGSWEGPIGTLEIELPEKFKDLEDNYRFYSDGTFEYTFNSSKENGRGHVRRHGEMVGYWIGYRYEIIKGTYQINNSHLITNCTYRYEEFEHDYEFLDGTKADHESHKSEEGIGKDLIGGRIEVIDNNTFILHKLNGENYKLQKIQ